MDGHLVDHRTDSFSCNGAFAIDNFPNFRGQYVQSLCERIRASAHFSVFGGISSLHCRTKIGPASTIRGVDSSSRWSRTESFSRRFHGGDRNIEYVAIEYRDDCDDAAHRFKRDCRPTERERFFEVVTYIYSV